MADPVTLTVLGAFAATEGIKFLYGQASEVLKTWRERRKAATADELVVPVVATEVLDGEPTGASVDAELVEREQKAFIQLAGSLSPYAQGLAEIDLTDEELAEQAGRLRALLEAAYGQRFTFRGEQRDRTGTRVSVRQVLGEVAGTAVGVEADIAAGAEISVEQQADKVTKEGSVTGFKGDIRSQ
jgi:hypothetical protein